MDYLFIYGTLLMTDNPYGMYLSKHSDLMCSGWFKGMLYDAGDYPAAIYEPECDFCVHGSVLTLKNPDEALEMMDEYEGFGPGESQPNEFIRTLLSVENAREPLMCWVYLYNLPTGGLKRIEGGNYLEYLSARP